MLVEMESDGGQSINEIIGVSLGESAEFLDQYKVLKYPKSKLVELSSDFL